LKAINITKGQIVQRSGELNTKVFTVESGLLRSYSIDNKGKEHIYKFAPENWIIADNYDIDIPCDLFIDAIEGSKINETRVRAYILPLNFSAVAYSILLKGNNN
jgi:CRP-like cAMP-binding protein